MGPVASFIQTGACFRYVHACILGRSVIMQVLLGSSNRRIPDADVVLKWSLQQVRQRILLCTAY